MESTCPFKDQVWELAKTSDEVKSFVNSADVRLISDMNFWHISCLFQVQAVLGNLTNYCGQPVDIDNLWIITNALYIEVKRVKIKYDPLIWYLQQIYYNATLRTKNNWFTDAFYAKADAINDQVQLFQNGIFKSR